MKNTLNIGVGALYKFQTCKVDSDGNTIESTRVDVTDWFHNVITNGGMDLLGENFPISCFGQCRVGAGSTTPSETDTGLVSQIATTTTQQALTNGVSGSAPYYGYIRKTFRFAIGTAAGNLSEVAIFGGVGNTICFSRALIKNGSGDPITITVLSDEVLDVIYEFRSYAPDNATYGPLDISGTDYSGDITPAQLNGADYPWGDGYNMWGAGGSYGSVGLIPFNGNQAWNTPIAFGTQTLGAITSRPSGTKYYSTSVTASAYTSGTYYRDHEALFDLNQGNIAGGIGSLHIPTSMGSFQVSFTPKIAKTSTYRFKLNIRVAWGRYVA